MTPARRCSVAGCNRPYRAKGYCAKHYERWRTHGNPMLGRGRGNWGEIPIQDRFWIKVDRREPDSCWEWQGARTTLGYGQVRFNGRTTKAHRVAWVLHHGAIPQGMAVCHRCDNPPCVNVEHLFLGTLSDNAQDMALKGRLRLPDNRALRNPRGKLSDDDVAEIRGLKHVTAAAELASRFGVTPAHIRSLWRGGQRPHVLPREVVNAS